jgi:hypothetical protein
MYLENIACSDNIPNKIHIKRAGYYNCISSSIAVTLHIQRTCRFMPQDVERTALEVLHPLLCRRSPKLEDLVSRLLAIVPYHCTSKSEEAKRGMRMFKVSTLLGPFRTCGVANSHRLRAYRGGIASEKMKK